MANDEEKQLPELQDATLDASQLSQLFRDYRHCVDVLETIVKRGPGLVTEHSSPTLDEAERLIQTGAVRGLQIRYVHQGEVWWDTLLPLSAGVRLVRIRHSEAP